MELSGPAPFSDMGAEVIARTVDVEAESHIETEGDLDTFYEVARSVEAIREVGAKRVALQFPDEWLGDAAKVARELSGRLGEEVQVVTLADTSYGSCCVDEVAASHADADLVIHYGRSCLSPTQRLPVVFVFGKKRFDVQEAAEALAPLIEGAERKPCLLTGDVEYAWAMTEVAKALETRVPGIKVYPARMKEGSLYSPPAQAAKKNDACGTQEGCCKAKTPASESVEVPMATKERLWELPEGTDEETAQLLFIGTEGPALSNLMMTHSQCSTLSYSPKDRVARKESTSVNRALMRRYYLVQQAKDAEVIGIVVGTLGVASYMGIIDYLQRMIRKAGRKSYTFVMGKLNVAKMANFPEIDAFVLVACPETSLVDSKEYLKPIVTPYELELALVRGKEWSARYVTDFHTLLEEQAKVAAGGSSGDVDADEDEGDQEDIPHFSLITGQFKNPRRHPTGMETPTSSGGSEQDIALRNKETALALLSSPAAERLQAREFQGLEQDLGGAEVGEAVQGRVGIARGYTNERE